MRDHDAIRTSDPSTARVEPRYFRDPTVASRSHPVEILMERDRVYGMSTLRLSTRRNTRSLVALWRMIVSLHGYESFTRTFFPSGTFGISGSGRNDVRGRAGRGATVGESRTDGLAGGGVNRVLDHFGA